MEKTNQEILDILYSHISNKSSLIMTELNNSLGYVLGILLILGIVIIWNQRKIKKMLRKLQEQMKQKEQDKPD